MPFHGRPAFSPGAIGDVGLAALPSRRIGLDDCPPAGTVDEWAAQVRRTLRVPGIVARHPRSWFPSVDDGRCVWAPVDAATLEQFRVRYQQDASWCGFGLRVPSASDGELRRVQAFARLRAELPEGRVLLHAVLELEPSDESVELILRQLAGIRLLHLGVTLRDEGLRSLEYEVLSALLTKPSTRLRGLLGDAPPRILADLVGDERCEHPEGAWSLDETVDALELNCPSCLHRRLAVVPLHRLPDGHPLLPAPAEQRAYLERLLRRSPEEGPQDAPESFDQLRARDGIVSSMAPADHAIRGPHARPADLRSALSGRRRG